MNNIKALFVPALLRQLKQAKPYNSKQTYRTKYNEARTEGDNSSSKEHNYQLIMVISTRDVSAVTVVITVITAIKSDRTYWQVELFKPRRSTESRSRDTKRTLQPSSTKIIQPRNPKMEGVITITW